MACLRRPRAQSPRRPCGASPRLLRLRAHGRSRVRPHRGRGRVALAGGGRAPAPDRRARPSAMRRWPWWPRRRTATRLSCACRFVIEEVKRRVPIWKREYYADGTAAWVDPTAARVATIQRMTGMTCLDSRRSSGARSGSLRISVTDRCNMRCRYCMPEEEYVWLPRESILTFEEIDRLAGIFAGLGVAQDPPHRRRAAAAARPAGAGAPADVAHRASTTSRSPPTAFCWPGTPPRCARPASAG